MARIEEKNVAPAPGTFQGSRCPSTISNNCSIRLEKFSPLHPSLTRADRYGLLQSPQSRLKHLFFFTQNCQGCLTHRVLLNLWRCHSSRMCSAHYPWLLWEIAYRVISPRATNPSPYSPSWMRKFSRSRAETTIRSLSVMMPIKRVPSTTGKHDTCFLS